MTGSLADVRSVLLPDPAGRHGPLPPVLLSMTVVTGLVDAFSYLTLGHVFVANMTGNVVFLGFALADAPGFSISASVTALAAFAAGAFGGGGLIARYRDHPGRLHSSAAACQAVSLAAVRRRIAVTRSPSANVKACRTGERSRGSPGAWRWSPAAAAGSAGRWYWHWPARA